MTTYPDQISLTKQATEQALIEIDAERHRLLARIESDQERLRELAIRKQNLLMS